MTKGHSPRFLSPLPSKKGPAGDAPRSPARRTAMPLPADTKAPHTSSPPGGRSPGLLRLGWSRANGRALPPARVPPRRGACGLATLSPRASTPEPRPTPISAPQRTATDSTMTAGCAKTAGFLLLHWQGERTKAEKFQAPETWRKR